jgi:hypothetical protein
LLVKGHVAAESAADPTRCHQSSITGSFRSGAGLLLDFRPSTASHRVLLATGGKP